MIALENVSKSYRTRHGKLAVFNDVSMLIQRGEKIGILGANGSGKSTLVRLLGGVEQPTSGVLRRDMNVSWPLAFSGGFQPALTGLDNLRFVCRVYGVDSRPLQSFIEDFSELGTWFREPVKTYSSGMRARLAFALSMAIEFDCYLVDEVLAVGDARFQEKCQVELFEKRRDRGLIIVSHVPEQIRGHCERAYVLHAGTAIPFDSVDEAFDYHKMCSQEPEHPPTARLALPST
jgi:capsular polysaccharide transport system ATP-binding protein